MEFREGDEGIEGGSPGNDFRDGSPRTAAPADRGTCPGDGGAEERDCQPARGIGPGAEMALTVGIALAITLMLAGVFGK